MATRNITIVNTTEKNLDFKYMTERKRAYDQRSTFESIQFVLIKQARGTGGIQPRKQNIRIDSVFDSSIQFVLIKQARAPGGMQPRKQELGSST